MTTDNIKRLVSEFKEHYTGAKTAEDGGNTLVRLPSVDFPEGCNPQATEALVLLDPSQGQPQLFLRVIPTLPNGGQPRNANPVTFAGEAWYTYSFNLQWNENLHTAVQFVAGRLRRFACSD